MLYIIFIGSLIFAFLGYKFAAENKNPKIFGTLIGYLVGVALIWVSLMCISVMVGPNYQEVNSQYYDDVVVTELPCNEYIIEIYDLVDTFNIHVDHNVTVVDSGEFTIITKTTQPRNLLLNVYKDTIYEYQIPKNKIIKKAIKYEKE